MLSQPHSMPEFPLLSQFTVSLKKKSYNEQYSNLFPGILADITKTWNSSPSGPLCAAQIWPLAVSLNADTVTVS